MSRHYVHVHSYPAQSKTQHSPLLFVHGGYTHSGYWEHNFVPFFRRHGFDCFSVDLSGHGASAGKERLNQFGIDDYAADIAHAIRQIGQPVTIIGHSMGCLATQRYLEMGSALAAVFLAPVPSTGTLGSATQLALRYPDFFQAVEETIAGVVSEKNNDLLAKIYFSPEAKGADVADFLPSIGPESQQAIMEMAILPIRPALKRCQLPTLVIGGEADAIFPPSHLFFSALPWRADIVRVPRAGHMLPLDERWEHVATHILDWALRKLAPPAGQTA